VVDLSQKIILIVLLFMMWDGSKKRGSSFRFDQSGRGIYHSGAINIISSGWIYYGKWWTKDFG